MKQFRIYFAISGGLFLAFLLVTILVMNFDVMSIGPRGSSVGFATANKFVFERLGANLKWYHLTDVLGLVAISVAFGFGLMGVRQWISRKSLFKVDGDILLLGGFYLLVVILYIFFEKYIVNYRPILRHGDLEASFPSSHTMIVISILGTAIIQFQKRVKHDWVRKILEVVAGSIITLTVVGRLLSGVHWLTDIVAGLLLGAGLTVLYQSVLEWLDYQKF